MSKTTIAQAIDLAYEQDKNGSDRKHLGMSQIGAECERQIWYSFNKAKTVQHSGRLLRLFQFGHDMEQGFADLLKSIGFRVYLDNPATGEQFHVQDPDNKFFSGSLDGVAVSPSDVEFYGVEPDTAYLVDYKTANKSSFNQFVKKGLFDWNIKYYLQLICYMGFSDQLGKKPIRDAMIFVFNKDNHEIATETIKFNQELFDAMRARAFMIVESEKPPVRISDDPENFKCRFCDYKEICHGEELAEPSCRLCGFCQKKAAKGERCEKGYKLTPCAEHIYNPNVFEDDFIPIQYHMDDGAMEYDAIVNAPARNKDKFGDKPVLTSKEIYELYLQNDDKELIDTILEFAGKFDAGVDWL
jgi:hypothetical protein